MMFNGDSSYLVQLTVKTKQIEYEHFQPTLEVGGLLFDLSPVGYSPYQGPARMVVPYLGPLR